MLPLLLLCCARDWPPDGLQTRQHVQVSGVEAAGSLGAGRWALILGGQNPGLGRVAETDCPIIYTHRCVRPGAGCLQAA